MSEEIDYEKLSFNDDDLFERRKFADSLTCFIDNYTVKNKEPLVIALDANWGTGKTWFIHKWKNMLREGNRNIIYYNAWEHDDWNSAFIPIITKIKEQFPNYKTFVKEGAKVIITGAVIANQILRKYTGYDSKEAADDINKLTEDAVDVISHKYREHQNAKKEFKKSLEKILDKKGQIFFFIDELDRCRPTFAIETLETIKHFFNVKGLVFIISLDMLQLSYSVSTVYGQNMDSSGYLSRFFNYKFSFSNNNLKRYIESKMRNDKLNDKIFIISEAAGLSIREADRVLDSYMLIKLGVLNGMQRPEVLEIYFFLVVLKYKYPKTYRMIFDKSMDKYQSSFEAQDGEITISKINRMGQNIARFFDDAKQGILNKSINEIVEIKPDDSEYRAWYKSFPRNVLEYNNKLIDLFANDLELVNFND